MLFGVVSGVGRGVGVVVAVDQGIYGSRKFWALGIPRNDMAVVWDQNRQVAPPLVI